MIGIPELLITYSGKFVKTKEEWEAFRRPEIMSLMANNIYGVRPVERPADLHFEIEKEEENYLGAKVDYKKINICFGGYSFDVHGYFPKNTTQKVPAFIHVMHEVHAGNFDFETQTRSENVDVEEVIRRGYALFILPTFKLYPDTNHKCEYKAGVFTVLGPDPDNRPDNAWASISVWAWGASRVLDYIETDDRVDETKVSVLGHSRGGKVALWCGATDKRVACAISNSSGCAGAAMHRTTRGERIKDINRTDWFCKNYHNFNDNEKFLPTDQHMLIAAMAPRLCYVQSSSEDAWADPEAERLSCRMAGDAYALYGKKGAVLPKEPVELDTPYHEGSIGYHCRTGEHGLVDLDWKMFMDFTDKKLK